MFGTIMRARVKKDRRDEFARLMMELTPSEETGFHSAQAGWEDKDDDRVVVIAFFRDRDSYRANAERPQTDENYRKMIDFLDGEPEWIDVNWTEYTGKPLGETAPTRA